MIIHPRLRGFICTVAHPKGCKKNVLEQIQYVKSQEKIERKYKKVLIIGASMGYGLASRIEVSFGGNQAGTIGVIFEREGTVKKTASAGWYNTVGFEEYAKQENKYAKTINGDAFSNEIKQQVVDLIKKDWGKIDLLVYSLASPRRKDPNTGQQNQSVLKTINAGYTNQSLNLNTYELEQVTLEKANQQDIEQTINVMGGEDWEMWFDILKENNLLEDNFKTIAYSYMGPELTQPIYRNGTIGKAKDHLEKTVNKIDKKLIEINGKSFVSINKALVTQSSTAIPFIPLYFVLLKKVMMKKGIEEDCIQQISRLFREKLNVTVNIPVDNEGRIRDR